MKIENICALEKIKKLKDNSQDIIYADPPYALGSTVLIGKDGKPYYKEARDFMSKWEMPDEKFWESFFQEANRVLKHGGRVLFFGIDRQLFLFQYYAVASGLEIKQSLYWYFISNFPKATDLSKQIEKRLGVKPIGSEKPDFGLANADKGYNTVHNKLIMPDTQTDLGKKYEGFKYSISPLKQVLETVMVFQKPTKNKSVLDDVFAYEDGDLSISPSVWGIDEGRVPSETTTDRIVKGNSRDNTVNIGNEFQTSSRDANTDGRFPSQLFIDKECASKIDEQSGEEAEASKILHHIEYLDEELDLVKYSPKVSTFEREIGCDGTEEYGLNSEISNKDRKEIERILN